MFSFCCRFFLGGDGGGHATEQGLFGFEALYYLSQASSCDFTLKDWKGYQGAILDRILMIYMYISCKYSQ